MISFLCSLAVLIIGYFLYGRLVESAFGADSRETPALKTNDGVDFVPLKTSKAFLVQLLNIAGTGPIFGALMGAVFGPIVFLWIVLGSILGGAVHDYLTGMISIRMNGASVVEIAGRYIGKYVRYIMLLFSVVLLVLVGAVFINSPAALLASLTPEKLNARFWIIVIIIYYILATLLPIDKLIGRIYPVFGVLLMVMAVGIFGGIVCKGYVIPEISLTNMHPTDLPAWPFMFVTVACGAISGFHATQSPIISRCLKTERDGRRVFYGAMLAESVIALIWAAAGTAFYGSTDKLQTAIASLGQSGTVYEISVSLLGTVGGILAIVGVVVCPITSGDTAFRSARLIIAESIGMEQKKLSKRLIITLPLMAVAFILTYVNFDVLWRYFLWSNQTLAMIVLWAGAVYLMQNGKHPSSSLIAAFPAAFMTAVSVTYILMADEGLGIPMQAAYPIGAAAAVLLSAVFAVKLAAAIKADKAHTS